MQPEHQAITTRSQFLVQNRKEYKKTTLLEFQFNHEIFLKAMVLQMITSERTD